MVPDGIFRLVGVIMLLVFVLGLILNIVVVILFRVIYNESPNCTNMLTLSMSYCNILHCVTYPLNIVASFQKMWDFGPEACEADAFFVHWMSITTIAHLTMLSVDRYIKVTGKRIPNKVHYKRGILIGCWLYGFLWAILPLLGWSKYDLEGIGISCSIKFGSPLLQDIAYELTIFVTDFVFPLTIIIVCQLAVFRNIRLHNLELNDGNEDAENFAAALALEKQLISLIVLMVAAFIFAWTPYAIVSFVTVFHSTLVHPIAATFPAIFAKAAVCYFPIIYGFKHAAVKRGFRKILTAGKGNQVNTITDRVVGTI